jgi:hypothetical protein
VTPDPPTTTAAFYARRGGRIADWWTLLHPPYTIWHVSYAVIGAALAPRLSWAMLGATVLAFLLAVGVCAHALDELHGRPLGTAISDATLRGISAASLLAAVLIGALAVPHAGPLLVPAIAVGIVLVLGYNLELFGGRLHTDLGFALAWGGFPVAVGFLAQRPPLLHLATLAAALAVLAAVALSVAQRRLSTPARLIRRRLVDITATAIRQDGTAIAVRRKELLAPLEGALRAMSLAVPLVAAALLLVRAH